MLLGDHCFYDPVVDNHSLRFESYTMITYYVSLTGPLLDYYLIVEAPSNGHLRVVMQLSKLQKLWCSVYTEAPADARLIPITGSRLMDGVSYYDYTRICRSLGLDPYLWSL